MPLNIKDADTHTLAKRLASLTGESLTKAVKHAIEEKLAQLEKTQGAAPLAEELDRIALQCAKLPRRDRPSADRIIGYDENEQNAQSLRNLAERLVDRRDEIRHIAFGHHGAVNGFAPLSPPNWALGAE